MVTAVVVSSFHEISQSAECELQAPKTSPEEHLKFVEEAGLFLEVYTHFCSGGGRERGREGVF